MMKLDRKRNRVAAARAFRETVNRTSQEVRPLNSEVEPARPRSNLAGDRVPDAS